MWFMICSLRYSVVVSHSVVCTRVYIYIYRMFILEFLNDTTHIKWGDRELMDMGWTSI